MLYNLFENRDFVSVFAVALLAEGVDRNYFFFVPNRLLWEVALLAEGVDRNTGYEVSMKTASVALLAEGVDRNTLRHDVNSFCMVALLAEGVDRNFLAMLCLPPPLRSPSSRRAWIEIKNLLTKEEIYGSRPPRGGRG